jgi:hypothetical protein
MREQHQPIALIEPLLVRVQKAPRILSVSCSTSERLLNRRELPSGTPEGTRCMLLVALRAWVKHLNHSAVGASLDSQRRQSAYVRKRPSTR